LLKCAVQAGALVLAIALSGAGLVWYYNAVHQITAIAYAGSICLTITIISLIPMAIAARKNAVWLAQACFAGSMLRMLLTLTISLVVFFEAIAPGQKIPFALWMLGFYTALLIWETQTILKLVKSLYK